MVSEKVFLVNLASPKPKNIPLPPNMVVPHVAAKYNQFSLEQILKSEQLYKILNKTLIDVWQYSEYPRILNMPWC